MYDVTMHYNAWPNGTSADNGEEPPVSALATAFMPNVPNLPRVEMGETFTKITFIYIDAIGKEHVFYQLVLRNENLLQLSVVNTGTVDERNERRGG